MSHIEITDHNEFIYKILDKPPPEAPRTPRYESALEKHLKQIKKPQSRRTMGYAETPVPPPEQFLKKGEGILQPQKDSHHKCILGHLPAVPRRPPPGKKEKKSVPNFKVINIKKAIKSKPKPHEPRLVDTRTGHVKVLAISGEIPQYCLRKDFGELPKYLVKRTDGLQRKLENLQYQEDHHQSLCRAVNEKEREELLRDLKRNWDVKQKAFLQLPMLTDTTPKVLKKSKMEQELKQLERDIALVENNPYIYVYD